MREKSSTTKETRTRNWTVVLYPESAPYNWRDVLDELHIEWVESPVHNKDINANGEAKKEHIHLLLMFGGVKSYEQVIEVIDGLNCTIPQRVHNARALVRYMAHLDNPEKAQYSISDIRGHGGVDIAEMLRPSSSERYTLIGEMISFVRENNIEEFQDLMDYAYSNEFDTWFPLLCDNSAYVVGQYINSQRNRNECLRKKTANSAVVVDKATGEIISE